MKTFRFLFVYIMIVFLHGKNSHEVIFREVLETIFMHSRRDILRLQKTQYVCIRVYHASAPFINTETQRTFWIHI